MENKPYQEILKLFAYCHRIGICAEIKPFVDGYKINFPNGSDFVQHCGSYGAIAGYVEPAIGSKADYTAVSLKNAKALVKRHKDRLNGGVDNV